MPFLTFQHLEALNPTRPHTFAAGSGALTLCLQFSVTPVKLPLTVVFNSRPLAVSRHDHDWREFSLALPDERSGFNDAEVSLGVTAANPIK